jgi:uncharacterized protein (DUF1800 family)
MTRAHRSTIAKPGVTFSSSLCQTVSLAVMFTMLTSLAAGGMPLATADTKASAGLTAERKIIHLLNRIGYGPRPGDIERVERIGLDQYIDRQLHPETIDDAATEARLEGLESLRMSNAERSEKYPDRMQVARQLGLRPPAGAVQEPQPAESGMAQRNPPAGDSDAIRQPQDIRQQILAYYAEHGLNPPQKLLQELQAQKLIRAAHSERQLLEAMTDFWFNHFNVFWGKGADRWLTTDFEMHAIRPHALGKFQDLLLATAKHPAMLFYLDNFLSSSPDAKRPDSAGQSELFPGRAERIAPFGAPPSGRPENPLSRTSGFQRDMTDADQPRQMLAEEPPRRQPGINENYARELMELHTMGVDGGYTQKDVQEVARCFTGWTIERPRRDAKFVFRAWMHDTGEKVVLGHMIPAGGGIKDGETVIDILAHHPSTARFISTKLVRRFVSDNPPPALVDRIVTVYTKTDGDIREMLRTIFTAAEFYAPEAYRAKIKSPFELAASAIRALDGETDGSPRMAQFVAKMGQALYRYQSPTGYPDRAEQWVNTGALLERLNFALALSANGIPGTVIDPARTTGGIDPAQPERLMARAIDVLLHGDVSAQTRAVLERQLREDSPVPGELPGEAGQRAGTFEGLAGTAAPAVAPGVAEVVGWVLGSPEFQRR